MSRSPDSFARLCHLTGQAVCDYDMIRDGDRILLGLSGGVDSMMLMHVLDRLRRHTSVIFSLFAVTIDEGFEKINRGLLKSYAKEQGWNLKIIAPPIARLIIEKKAERKPCGLCARLRRGYVYSCADELNCNKIALAHHRDDLCVSLLMSLFRGGGLKTMGPNVPADSGRKRIIRPFCYVPKDLIEICARKFKFPDIGNCDYAQQLDASGDRAFLERLLPQLEKHFPNLGKNMLKSMQDLRPDYLLDRRYIKTGEKYT